MAIDGNKTLRHNRSRSTFRRAIDWVSKSFGILNFNFFYSLSLLIMTGTDGAVFNLALLGLVNIFAGLPLAMIFSPIQALSSFFEAKQKNWRIHPTIRFGIDLFYAFAIVGLGAAVYVTFLIPEALSFPLLLAVNIPLIIAAIAAKAIYNIGAGIYYINKAVAALDNPHKDRAISQAISYLTYGGGYALITGSMIALYFFPLVIPPAILIVGICGCTLTFIALMTTIGTIYKHKLPKNSGEVVLQQDPVIESSNSKLHKGLGIAAEVREIRVNETETNLINTPPILDSRKVSGTTTVPADDLKIDETMVPGR